MSNAKELESMMRQLINHKPGLMMPFPDDPAERLALADTLAAGRVFEKLREAWEKDREALCHYLSMGPDHPTMMHLARLFIIAMEGDLVFLEAAADKVFATRRQRGCSRPTGSRPRVRSSGTQPIG